MSFTNYLEDKLIEHFLGIASFTPPSSWYLALGTSEPGEDSWGGEVSGNGYSRQSVTFHRPETDLKGVSRVRNAAKVTFNQATGSWGTITHFAVFDASTGGNLLAFGTLNPSRAINNGDVYSVAEERIAIPINGNLWSKYLAEALLKHAFCNVSFTAPTIYVACCNRSPLFDFDGTRLAQHEPSSGGYARVQHSGSGKWDLRDNVGAIEFPEATADWNKPVKACALVDASSGGNLLCECPVSVFQGQHDITSGETARITDGTFDVDLE